MLDEAMDVLETAARYRAGGDSWEEVSTLLKRPVRELKALAWERRDEWAGLYVQAASFTALEVLTDLARHENPFVAKDAAKTILTHSRWQAGTEGGLSTPGAAPLGARGEAMLLSEPRQGGRNLDGLTGGQKTSFGNAGEEQIIQAGELATERLLELLHDEKSWVALRAAQSILVQVRSWWSWTHVRPRAPQREKKRKEIDWKKVLPWYDEDAPPEPDRISIHENSALLGREGIPERVVAFARLGNSAESWEKTGAEAEEYIRELVQGEKPGVEFMWYGHWRETHFERIAGRDNVPWPPPEEMVSGRWYAVWDEEARGLKVKPLPDTWQTGDPEPPDGWGPNSRASPN